jgi:hypothetical protein
MKVHIEEEDKLLSGLYYQIGKQYAEHFSKDMEDMDEAVNQLDYPEGLNAWFQEFLQENEKKEQNVRRRKQLNGFSRRAAIFLIVIISGFALTTLSVEAFRLRLFNFVTEIKDQYTKIEFRENSEPQEENIELYLDNTFYPAYMPGDYTLTESQEFGNMRIMHFSNKEGKAIEIAQSPIGTSFQVDTENAVTTEVELNNGKGILVVKGDMRSLIWTIDQTALYIIGEINEAEIIKIAENITFKEKIEK